MAGMRKVLSAVSAALAVPVVTAFICNLIYAWPCTLSNMIRNLHPRRVYLINCVIIRELMKLRFLTLLIRWKYFYSHTSRKHLEKDIPYGRNGQKLDLYFPTSLDYNSEGNLVVIYVFGGAYSSGDKSMYGLLCSNVSQRLDAVVCCPNYSIYPQGYMDDMLRDVVDCVTWVYVNISHFGGDPNRIMLVGFSCGAHLCALSLIELLHCEKVDHSSEMLASDSIPHGLAQECSGVDPSASVSDRHLTSEVYNENSTNADGFNVNNKKFDSFDTDNQYLDSSNVSNKNIDSFNSNNQNIESFTAISQNIDSLNVSQSIINSDRNSLTLNSHNVYRYSACDKISEFKEKDQYMHLNSTPENLSDISLGQSSLENICLSIKAFVGLGGVYDIRRHYEYEEERGVECVSSMARAAYGHKHFNRLSPSFLIHSFQPDSRVSPVISLIHGLDDVIVPYRNSQDFARQLKTKFDSVKLYLIGSCDHPETCLHLMDERFTHHERIMSMLEDTVQRMHDIKQNPAGVN